MGIEMWKQGCSQKIFKTKLRLRHDDSIKELKQNAEVPTSLN